MMCITAHPDDECGGFGGALLMAHAAGVETTVLCLTEGQAATNRGDAASGAELARMRRAEFDAAGEILGLTRGEVLHYPDGQLASQDLRELIGVMVERIRQWRPQVVLTFGGEGSVNLHPDHTAVSISATAAFHWAGRATAYPEQLSRGIEVYAPQKLYYAVPPFLMSRDEQAKAGARPTPYSLVLELGEWKEKKFEAFRQHTSQATVLNKAREAFDATMNVEQYLLVAAPGCASEEVRADRSLFQGVVED
jgi:LmbE family N-acetylglucosaminyl deacetylase